MSKESRYIWILMGCWIITLGMLIFSWTKKPPQIRELDMKKWILQESLKELEEKGTPKEEVAARIRKTLQKRAQEEKVIFVDRVIAAPLEVEIKKESLK